MPRIKPNPADRTSRATTGGRDRKSEPPSSAWLQDRVGNSALEALIRQHHVQAKLTVSQPEDPAEQEAERVASAVVSEVAPPEIQRACTCGTGVPCSTCEESPTIQRQANTGGAASSAPETLLRSNGRPLDPATKGFFEDRFARDFSDVRIHTGSDAAAATRALAADAFTKGSDIAFASGHYEPETAQGKHLLAHELTHVVQQRAGRGTDIQRRSPEESTASSITEDYAAGLSDNEIVEHAQAVVARARTLDNTDAEYAALLDNLRILLQERANRNRKKSPGRSELIKMMMEWQAAGLLNSPYRPADVPEIPPLPVTQEQAAELGPAPIAIGAAVAAPKFLPEPVPVSPAPRPPLRLVPPPEPVPPTAPVPGRVPVAVPIIAFLAVTLWPSETAPRWLDELNPITGGPYASPEEYDWIWRRLTPPQRDYLERLGRVRRITPDPAQDAEPDPRDVPVPIPKPKPKDDEPPESCVAMDVPRRGGHARHDAYATKVTGSTFDYYVQTPFRVGINYDGLRKPILVWEVKVGHGWFFNPAYASLRDLVLARWDAQKNLGLMVAVVCGYEHLWTIPDKWVAALLNTRWGGVPPVLSIRE